MMDCYHPVGCCSYFTPLNWVCNKSNLKTWNEVILVSLLLFEPAVKVIVVCFCCWRWCCNWHLLVAYMAFPLCCHVSFSLVSKTSRLHWKGMLSYEIPKLRCSHFSPLNLHCDCEWLPQVPQAMPRALLAVTFFCIHLFLCVMPCMLWAE